MPSKKRRNFTPGQKADAVELVRRVGSIAQVARDLELSQSSLYKWVQQAEIDEKRSPGGPLTTDERQELRRLQREVSTLQKERDFLKKAAAFFAKEDDRRSS